jgi:hypothetical protein
MLKTASWSINALYPPPLRVRVSTQQGELVPSLAREDPRRLRLPGLLNGVAPGAGMLCGAKRRGKTTERSAPTPVEGLVNLGLRLEFIPHLMRCRNDRRAHRQIFYKRVILTMVPFWVRSGEGFLRDPPWPIFGRP